MEKSKRITDSIDIAVNAYKHPPSMQLMKQRVTISEKYSFQRVSIKEILSKLKNLDPTKASPFGSTPVKTFTEHSNFLLHWYNSL